MYDIIGEQVLVHVFIIEIITSGNSESNLMLIDVNSTIDIYTKIVSLDEISQNI